MARDNKARHHPVNTKHQVKCAILKIREVLYRTDAPPHLIEGYIHNISDLSTYALSGEEVVADYEKFIKTHDEALAKLMDASAKASKARLQTLAMMIIAAQAQKGGRQ